MQFGKLMAAAAALTLAASPAIAADRAASKLSVANASQVRASTEAKKTNELEGAGIGVAVLAAIAIGLGIYVAVDEEDGPEVDGPTTP